MKRILFAVITCVEYRVIQNSGWELRVWPDVFYSVSDPLSGRELCWWPMGTVTCTSQRLGDVSGGNIVTSLKMNHAVWTYFERSILHTVPFLFVLFTLHYIFMTNSFQYFKIIWKSVSVLYIFLKWFWQGLSFSIVNSSRVGTVMSIKITKLPHSSCAWLLRQQLMSRAVGCEFGSDRSIIKGTLLREQSTSSPVSRLLEEIPWNSIFITFRACATNNPVLVEIRQ